MMVSWKQLALMSHILDKHNEEEMTNQNVKQK